MTHATTLANTVYQGMRSAMARSDFEFARKAATTLTVFSTRAIYPSVALPRTVDALVDDVLSKTAFLEESHS